MPQILRPQIIPVTGPQAHDLLLQRRLDQLWAAVHALEGKIQTLTTDVAQQTARIDAIVSALGATESE